MSSLLYITYFTAETLPVSEMFFFSFQLNTDYRTTNDGNNFHLPVAFVMQWHCLSGTWYTQQVLSVMLQNKGRQMCTSNFGIIVFNQFISDERCLTRNVGQCKTWRSPCRTQVALSVQRRKVWLTPTTRCRAVTLPRRETRWNLQGCPKLANRSQPLVGRSSPYYQDIWRTYRCLTSFFQLSICALVAKI